MSPHLSPMPDFQIPALAGIIHTVLKSAFLFLVADGNQYLIRMMPALRWLVALPLAILAAIGAQRIVGFFVRTDFHHVWILADATFFLMAAAFVGVGVFVAPSRKDSVARIALSVVVFWGVLFIAGG